MGKYRGVFPVCHFLSLPQAHWQHVETIELVNDGTGLGFGIVGGKSTGVIVKTILPGGIADQVSIISISRSVNPALTYD